MTVKFPELGYYGLPGHVVDPRPLVEEVRMGEELGLGSIWLSERLNTKHVGVLGGLAAAHSPNMGIASGLIANLPLRNPLVTAGFASTMSLLTGNRFALGMGRGQPRLSSSAGVAASTFRVLEDYIAILRALWDGQSVKYSGPLGEFDGLSLGLKMESPPPIIMAVMGDKTCHWAGRHCDGVVFNSLWSPTGVERSVKMVRKGAEEAGRDPHSIRIWTIAVTACDLSEDEMLTFIVRRMNTYLAMTGMYEAICEANGWDSAVIGRALALKSEIDGQANGTLGDENTSSNLDEIKRFLDIYPREWIEDGCIVGNPSTACDKMMDRFNAGADSILLHGSGPKHLRELLSEWNQRRPAARFDGLSANPGL